VPVWQLGIWYNCQWQWLVKQGGQNTGTSSNLQTFSLGGFHRQSEVGAV